ncbi:MAG TPA: TetR/AcrR family transcriptional regulator [Gemmatimonadaceae bacterium]
MPASSRTARDRGAGRDARSPARERPPAARAGGAPAPARPPGRPRSEPARRAILGAALALLAEHGYRALTMERIAATAGVGKQTVYRWWPSKAAVVLTALGDHAEERIPLPDTGDGRADVTRFIRDTLAAWRGPAGPIVRALMAEAQLDPAFARLFREQLIDRRRAGFRALLVRARARGEIGPHADLELLMDLAYGAMWYRLLLDRAPLSAATAAAIARAVFAAGEAPTASGAARRKTRRTASTAALARGARAGALADRVAR